LKGTASDKKDPLLQFFIIFLKARLAQQTAETNGVLNGREIIFDAGEKSR
jgi:hypothetical protein